MRRLECEDGRQSAAALDSRGHTLVAWSGVLLLFMFLATAVGDGRGSDALIASGLLAVSIGYLTFVRQLPAVLDVVVILTALLNAAGWGGGLLKSVWFFDDMLHLLTPLTGGLLLGLRLGQAVGPPLLARRLLLWVLAASLSMSVGILWELAEWVANSFQRLEDTLPDLLLNTMGSLLGAALALWLMDRYPPELWRGRSRLG